MSKHEITGGLGFVPGTEGEAEIYVGAFVFDPMNRLVKVTRVEADYVETQFFGSYGAHCRYPASCLRPWKEEGK